MFGRLLSLFRVILPYYLAPFIVLIIFHDVITKSRQFFNLSSVDSIIILLTILALTFAFIGILFSYAQALEGDEKDNILYITEAALHSAIMQLFFLIFSIIMFVTMPEGSTFASFIFYTVGIAGVSFILVTIFRVYCFLGIRFSKRHLNAKQLTTGKSKISDIL